MTRTIDIIKTNKSSIANVWQEEASRDRENWCWMKYSMQIAIKVRARMKELGLTQTALASKIGCTQQYVSLLLKGRENLTLETIAKLESALDIALFGSPSSLVSGYSIQPESAPRYLNDDSSVTYGK